MRCAAHSLQLAVRDALNTKSIADIVNHCRNLVKKLRTPTMLAYFRNLKLNVPLIDQETRWSSCFRMMERLILLVPHIKEINDRELDLPENCCVGAKELRQI